MATVPTLPSFTDGLAPSLADLNNLAAGVTLVAKPIIARLRQTSGQSLAASSAANTITWNVADRDTDGGWSAVHPTRYTAQTAGWYMCRANIIFSTSGTSTTIFGNFQINGNSALKFGGFQVNSAAGITPGAAVMASGLTPNKLAVADYVELIVMSTSATAIATGVSYEPSRMSVNVESF